jgi:pyruvate-formate lyase-activating enzyme
MVLSALRPAPSGREIRKLKLAVTSSCTLRCSYCFVDKASGLELAPEAALEAVALLIDAPGRMKELEIYGGEPLLRFDFVRFVVDAAVERARAAGKPLSVALATNGLRLDDAHVDYLRRRGARVSVSFSGRAPLHDRLRRTASGGGSFARIRANLPRLFARHDRRLIDAILCVHPDGAASAAEDFAALADLGFEQIHLEVVHGVPWPAAARRAFRESLDALGSRLRRSLRAGRPVFLETFFDSFDRELAVKDLCPFYRDLEMFPGGEYSFYPYPFVSGPGERDSAAVGRAGEGFFRHSDCRFDRGAARCASCRTDYYVLRRVAEGNEPYRDRESFHRRLLAGIIDEARFDPRASAYLGELAARWRRRFR